MTQEVVYAADDVIALLDRFKIDHTFPAWSTNRWLTAMIVLFRPQIEQAIRARDDAFIRLKAKAGDVVIYEDETEEILSDIPIDIAAQITAISNEITRRAL